MEEHRPKKLLDQVRACPACPAGQARELERSLRRLACCARRGEGSLCVLCPSSPQIRRSGCARTAGEGTPGLALTLARRG